MTDPELLFGQLVEAFNQRAWQRADALAENLLPLAPRHAAVHYITGIANLELQRLPRALAHLNEASALDPRNADYATQFAKALAMAQMTREAVAAADKACALTPLNPIALDTLGVIYSQTNEHAKAVPLFRRAVASDATNASYRFNLATSLVAIGEVDAAERELEACIELDPRFWKANLTLAQLRKQSATSNHIDRLKSLLTLGEDDPGAQTYLHMALGKECEDIADFPRAFEHYTLGKSAAGANRHYAIAQDEALIDAIIAATQTSQQTNPGFETNEPIFIIGMPRSGTTLVERIVSSHPDVYSAGELTNFGFALKGATGNRGPGLVDVDTVASAHDLDWKQLGESYLASTRPATSRKPRFIDKLPHNFLYAGFIAKALPQAKIICLRRHAMDACLSNFRQLFAPHALYYGYSFDLMDTGRYFIQFDRLMKHWQRTFPGRILEVPYEALVESQEEYTRRLLAFCELPWHADCLRFELNPAPVNTASATQVRAPVYRSALNRWKRYGAQMDRLQDLLRDAGIPVD